MDSSNIVPSGSDNPSKNEAEAHNQDDNGDIAMLKDVIRFYTHTGIYPFTYTIAMQEFLDNWSRQGFVSTDELDAKIEELKNKFLIKKQSLEETNAVIEPCDRELFELSEKIWGREYTATAERNNDSVSEERRHIETGLDASSSKRSPHGGSDCKDSNEQTIDILGPDYETEVHPFLYDDECGIETGLDASPSKCSHGGSDHKDDDEQNIGILRPGYGTRVNPFSYDDEYVTETGLDTSPSKRPHGSSYCKDDNEQKIDILVLDYETGLHPHPFAYDDECVIKASLDASPSKRSHCGSDHKDIDEHKIDIPGLDYKTGVPPFSYDDAWMKSMTLEDAAIVPFDREVYKLSEMNWWKDEYTGDVSTGFDGKDNQEDNDGGSNPSPGAKKDGSWPPGAA